MDGASSAAIGSPVASYDSFQSPLKSPSEFILSSSKITCDLDPDLEASSVSHTVESASKFPLSSAQESGNSVLLHQDKTPLFSPPLTRLAAKKYVSNIS